MLGNEFVSREKNLKTFIEMLLKWNSKINLISKSSVKELWKRHVIDSIQLKKFISTEETIFDLGSGGGFPGLVLSIEGYDVTLIESDIKKASFLKEVIRVLNLRCNVLNRRVESIDLSCDIIVCRGFSNINNIFKVTEKIKCDKFLLLKGENYVHEVDEAKKNWNFSIKKFKSITSDNSYILEIRDVQKKESNSNS